MLTTLGGRKFVLSVIAILCIVLLAENKAVPEAYMPIALIVASFAGANGWVESAYAKKVPSGD